MERQMTDYFYAQLSMPEKRCYQEIRGAMLRHAESVKVNVALLADSISKVLHALNYDNPDLYYVDFQQVNYVISAIDVSFIFNYLLDEKTLTVVRERIYRRVDAIMAAMDIAGAKDDFDKCRWLHNYLVKNVHYHEAAVLLPTNHPKAFCILGVFLENLAVCEGISKAYMFLCNLAGIDSMLVCGLSSNNLGGKNIAHIWNIVKIDGQYTHIDVTWDMNASQACRHMRYDYFCVSDLSLSADHTYSGFPSCSTDCFSYFEQKRLLFTGTKQFKDYLARAAYKNVRVFYFRIQCHESARAELCKKIHELISQFVANNYSNVSSIEFVTNTPQMIFFIRIT